MGRNLLSIDIGLSAPHWLYVALCSGAGWRLASWINDFGLQLALGTASARASRSALALFHGDLLALVMGRSPLVNSIGTVSMLAHRRLLAIDDVGQTE